MAGPSTRTHDLIVETALELFARHGYAGASMREIAQRVGIQPASLYSHFGSKEDLLWHVVRWTGETSSAIMADVEASAHTPLERFVHFFRSFVVFHAENRREALVTNTQWWSLNPERRAEAARHRQSYHDRAHSYVEAIHDAGVARVRSVDQTTLALLDLNIGVATWYRPAVHKEPLLLANDYVELALDVLRVRDNGRLPAAVRRTLERPAARPRVRLADAGGAA